MARTMGNRSRLRTRVRAVMAATLAAVLVGAGVQGTASAAPSDDAAVVLSIEHGGATYEGETLVDPGTSYQAKLQYSVPRLTPGQQVTITVPEGITVPAAALSVPSTNTVVESLALDGDGNVVLTFKDPLDLTIDQGVIAFTFEFDEPTEGTGFETFTWTLPGADHSFTVIVRDPGDELRGEIVAGLDKRVGSANLSGKVSRDVLTGQVTVAPSVASVAVPYTLMVGTAQAVSGVTIHDELSEYLAYDAGSFAATLTRWDQYGFNKTVAAYDLPAVQIDGQTFTVAGLDLPAYSYLSITYVAHVRADKVADLEAALQAAADAADAGNDNANNYSLTLANTASVGDFTDGASVTIGGTIAKPGIGAAFGKWVDSLSTIPLALDDQAQPVLPTPVTYALRAKLSEFAAFTGTKHELAQNIVITDTLPAQLSLLDEDFLTVTGGTLVPATAQCLAAGDPGSDLCVGQYVVTETADGRDQLVINVGRDVTASYVIKVSALVTTLEGMTATHDPSGQPQVQTRYRVRNTATFDYHSGADRSFSADVTLLQPKAPGSVIDDPSEFTKSTPPTAVTLNPGEVASVPWTFTLAEGAVPDLARSWIVDDVDTAVFDISDLDAIAQTITGTYGWAPGLTGADFDLSVVDGDLVIEPSATFGANLEWGASPQAPLTGRLSLTLELPTFPLQGKQSIDVSNSARVEGEDDRAYVWVSQSSGSATTYGDELEVAKQVYAGEGSWTSNVRAELDESGALVNDEFIYRVKLIPHGAYSGVRIIPLADVLPQGVTFLGFVDGNQLDSGAIVGDSTIAMGGNVEATWIEADRTVAIAQRAGTTLAAGAPIEVHFKVRVDEFTEDLGIVNSVGSAKATITPSHGYPLMVLKADSERPDVVITDRDARFTVTGPDGEVLTDSAYVVDGQLMVAGEDGDAGLVVPADAGSPDAVPAGQYTVTETVAPAGYALATAPLVVTVGEDGTSAPVTLYNDPLPLMAIGDLVWVDANQDGLQSDGEEVLAGVGVELIDAQTGSVVASTTTGEDGRYLFDLLEAGAYQVRFTLTEQQALVYTLTTAQVGDDDGIDSDADRATGTTEVITLDASTSPLVAADEYAYREVRALMGVDPTWDAGVVLRPGSVAVGDLVWLDTDANGRQEEGEPGIAGVVLTIVGPDGQPVVDIDGREVRPTTTDDQGRYWFGNLPILDEGQSYAVSIDRESSATALEALVPTRTEEGDRSGDSSLWVASSQGLTLDGEVDPTLDFGFIKVAVPEPEKEPEKEPVTEPEEGATDEVVDEGAVPSVPDEETLSSTGADVAGWVALAALLFAAGAGLVALRRRAEG
ncbi:SdrD B-like domain-containing protein [Demequina sp.]|uniref:SdrD B-like domain-containing protein n=1 Tax=Demequina sp. TaxID=2050685 RepID=UPI003A89B2F9